MAKPYSNDLRRKVIDAIELDGMKRSEASETFRISRNTINLWFQRKAQTGDIKPKQRHCCGHSHKIKDWEKFRAWVKQHADKTAEGSGRQAPELNSGEPATQKQMAELWEDEISDRTISRALKKIGFTRKKASA